MVYKLMTRAVSPSEPQHHTSVTSTTTQRPHVEYLNVSVITATQPTKSSSHLSVESVLNVAVRRRHITKVSSESEKCHIGFI